MKKLMFTMIAPTILGIAGLAMAGSVVGKAVIVGQFPEKAYEEMVHKHGDGDHHHEEGGMEHCHECVKFVRSLVVSGKKGVANAVISVEGIEGEFSPPEKNPVLDQKDLIFTPHVLPVLAGTVVDILNSDDVLHNVHAHSDGETLFNISMPEKGQLIPLEFEEPGVVRVDCDKHPHMQGFVVVEETPYFAVTDSTGAFRIDGVPAGKLTVKIWHERLGTQAQEVTVPETGEANVLFELRTTPELIDEIKKVLATPAH